MSTLFDDSSVLWALALVVVLPVLIIAAGELEERLRQRDSPLIGAVSIARVWVLPIFAVWALLQALLDVSPDSAGLRLVSSALLIAVAAAGVAILRVVVKWLGDRPREDGRAAVPRLLLALPRMALIIFTIWFLIAGVWDVDLSAALTALGVTSLVISLALQDTLSGIASGFLLLFDRPFKPGDWINTGDIEGRVVDVNWRSSRIVDRNGDLQVVPNAQLAGGVITNYDEPSRSHRVVVPVQVAFRNPPNVAVDMLLAAARATPGVVADPPPRVRVVQVDDPLMGYEIDLWIDDYTIAPQVASDFGALVWYQSERDGVPLPSPAQDLYIYDGVKTELAGAPDPAELRRRLRASPLLDQLPDDELDLLAKTAAAKRFARKEMILGPGDYRRFGFVIWEGTARLVVPGPDGAPLTVVDLGPGDIFGLADLAEGIEQPPAVIAVSDCEVVEVEPDAVAEVASRNPALAEIVNRLAATRRRRMRRALDRARRSLAAVAPDETDAGAGGGP